MRTIAYHEDVGTDVELARRKSGKSHQETHEGKILCQGEERDAE